MLETTIHFRCPEDLIRLLDLLAKQEGRTRSGMLVRLLRQALPEATEHAKEER